MPAAIEIHDSTVKSCEKRGGDIILLFEPAILHRSPGKPGYDAGEVFTVDVEIKLNDAVVITPFAQLPIDLTNGHLDIGTDAFDNCIPFATRVRGKVVIRLVDFYGREIQMTGSGLSTTATSEETWLESFPGMDK